MFRKASENIVENCGTRTLHAVIDLNSAEHYKPLCLVEKKKSFWPFKKASMNSTLVKITDLLTSNCEISGVLNLVDNKEFTLLKQFEELPILNIGGSLSAKIAKECNLDFKANDVLKLVLKLGDIEKNQVSWQKLHKELESKKINVNDEVFLTAKHSPRTSLCVVIESISTKDDGTVKVDKSSFSTDVDVDTGKTAIIPEIHVKGSVNKIERRSFTIPPGTVLAYSCVEFSVDDSGIIKLHAICDTLDDEPAPVIAKSNNTYENEDASQFLQEAIGKIKAEFQPLINSDKFIEFKGKLKPLLTDASESEFRVMNVLLHHANLYIGGNIKDKSILISTLKTMLGNELELPWKDVLLHLGFSVPKDASDVSASIEFPTSDTSGTLQAFMGLIDSIIDLSTNARKILPNITDGHIKIILSVVASQIRNENTSLKNPALQSMIEKDPLTLTFLTDCGFVKSLDANILTYTEHTRSLLDVYAVLYVLAGGN